jgi:CRP-like cAMP-binding protein
MTLNAQMPLDIHQSKAAGGLLAALPKSEFARLSPHLKTVKLHFKDVLTEAGEPVREAYFPHAAVVSLMAVMANGSSAEAATVGPEGFIGVGGLLGDDVALYRSIVQVAGEASRIDIAHLRAAHRQSGLVQDLLLRYIRAHLVQLSQSVVCNSLHTVEQRAARWLLMAHDRAKRDRFGLTHHFVSEMLGVRRATVSVVARKLQNAGLIRCGRQSIMITDRPGLEETACECYRIVRQAFDQLAVP